MMKSDEENGAKPTAAPADKGSNRGKSIPLALFSLAMVSMVSVYSYSTVLGNMNLGFGANAPAEVANNSVDMVDPMSRQRRLDTDAQTKARVAAILKETWPTCVTQHLNGIHCKTFIDEEILSLFTGDDRMTRTVLVEKRSILDVFYNSIVIYMDDDNLALGRDGDGLIYYDFEWDSTGLEASDEEQSESPPIIAEVDEDWNFNYEAEPVLVEGCTLAEMEDENNTKPCTGGIVIPKSTPNCPNTNFAEKLQAAKTLTVEPKGARDLPAFDCSCLSGYNCCLLIKATVRDADVYGKAIQCHLNFLEGTEKAAIYNAEHGKHVKIFTNHNFVVSKLPKVEGTWPVIE